MIWTLLLTCLLAAGANAAGLPFAIDSLDKAKEVVKQERDKHVLVFYSSPS